jgi:flagellar biogenesis protein FliO
VGKSGGPVALVGRLPLDGRRTVYLVRVARTVYVVGASEAGLFKLGELPDDGFSSEFELSAPRSFRETLERVLQRPRPSSDAPPEPAREPEKSSDSSGPKA